MSEYASASPKALAAFKASNAQKCAKWASKTAQFSDKFKVPFGTRSDVDDSEFYKLKPGEEDDIEVGSMGVPDRERMEMERSMGMHSRHHSHHHRVHRHRSVDYGPAPHTVMMPFLPGPMPGPPPPPFVVHPASPPPSAGYSTRRRRATSRAAPPPAPLPLHIPTPSSRGMPTHTPHPSAGSHSYISPVPTHAVPFISPPSSRMASPAQYDPHPHHRHPPLSSSSHSHKHKHRSKSVSRHGSGSLIYSPPVSPYSTSPSHTPGPSPVASPRGRSSRSPSVVYLPRSTSTLVLPAMAPVRHATLY